MGSGIAAKASFFSSPLLSCTSAELELCCVVNSCNLPLLPVCCARTTSTRSNGYFGLHYLSSHSLCADGAHHLVCTSCDDSALRATCYFAQQGSHWCWLTDPNYHLIRSLSLATSYYLPYPSPRTTSSISSTKDEVVSPIAGSTLSLCGSLPVIIITFQVLLNSLLITYSVVVGRSPTKRLPAPLLLSLFVVQPALFPLISVGGFFSLPPSSSSPPFFLPTPSSLPGPTLRSTLATSLIQTPSAPPITSRVRPAPNPVDFRRRQPQRKRKGLSCSDLSTTPSGFVLGAAGTCSLTPGACGSPTRIRPSASPATCTPESGAQRLALAFRPISHCRSVRQRPVSSSLIVTSLVATRVLDFQLLVCLDLVGNFNDTIRRFALTPTASWWLRSIDN